MADTLLSNEPSARGNDRYQVVVHVDTTALRDREAGTPGSLTARRCPAETARRLACDAAIVPLIERAGKPLSIGRKTRSVPPALRRALASRDRGCRFPGCTNRRTVDAHHIEHWANGGATRPGEPRRGSAATTTGWSTRADTRVTKAGARFRVPSPGRTADSGRYPASRAAVTGTLRESNRKKKTIDPEATVTL